MFNWFNRKYMDWEEYKSKVDFFDLFYWQQSVRKSNLKEQRQIKDKVDGLFKDEIYNEMKQVILNKLNE